MPIGIAMSTTPLVGVGVIVFKEDELLLLERATSHGIGTWSTPGGHLEYGESLELCAIRETEEETGVNVANPRFRGITNDLFEAENKHYITLWMEADYSSGEASINAEYEVSRVGWFKLDALPEPLFLPLQNLLEGNCYPPSAGATP